MLIRGGGGGDASIGPRDRSAPYDEVSLYYLLYIGLYRLASQV